MGETTDPAEKRRWPRQEVMRRGVVVHGPSGRSFTCVIVNVSLGGAKRQLTAPGLPHGDLGLVDPQVGAVHELRIAWRRDPFLGVDFTETAAVP